jgi:hypothetical protein
VSQTQDMVKRFILISEKHVEHDTKITTSSEMMSSQLDTNNFDSIYYQEDATYKLEEVKRVAKQVRELNSMFTQLVLIINTHSTMLDTTKGYANLVKSEKTKNVVIGQFI